MEISAEELLHKLQQHKELPRLLTAWGEEDYYRSQIAAAVPEYVFADVAPEDREITVFEKDTELRELAAVINTYPFFGGRSLIILRDEKLWGGRQDSDSKKQQLDKLAELLADIPEYCTVFLNAVKLDKRLKLYKLLNKEGVVCECKSVRPYELTPWLDQQAEQYGARFDREALALVMEYLAPVEKAPLQLLQQEIAKLAVYTGERHRWTRQDVEDIFAALPEASGFALSNFVADCRLTEALQVLAAERKKGTNILPVCALLLFKLRQLLQFLELRGQGYDPKSITGAMKLGSPYIARRLQEQCRHYTEDRLRGVLLAITQLNIDLRKGGRGYARLEEILTSLMS